VSTHSFARGGQPDGELGVRICSFYGQEYVALDIEPAVGEAHLTPAVARALAADLTTHADLLDPQPISSTHSSPAP